jgi:hypothetical protein
VTKTARASRHTHQSRRYAWPTHPWRLGLVTHYHEHFATLEPYPLETSLRGLKMQHWSATPIHILLLCINILLTNDLSILVDRDRTSIEWTTFWKAYTAKRSNLITFVQRQDLSKRDRVVATSVLTLLLNKLHGIQEHARSLSETNSTSQAPNDTTVIDYNYAHGSSWAWTKLMRYYYEPFDKKCVIHHTHHSTVRGPSTFLPSLRGF